MKPDSCRRNCRAAMGILAAMVLGFSVPVSSQLRIGADVFIGLNMAWSLDMKTPAIEIKDDFDQTYYDWNLASPVQMFLHGHIRINAIHVWNFSLGYMFWGHHQKYSEDTPEDLVKIGPSYPHSVDVSLHAMTLQWNVTIRGLHSRRVLPFVFFGAGPSYGLFKNYRWETTGDAYTPVRKAVFLDEEYRGWGYCAVIGVLLFRRTYFNIGLISLEDVDTPTRRMLEAGIGIVI